MKEKKISKMTMEQKKLAEDNMNLVHYLITRKLDVKQIEAFGYDDLAQTGFLALSRAAVTFDENYGTAFSSYAGKAIVNALYRQVKKDVPLCSCDSETAEKLMSIKRGTYETMNDLERKLIDEEFVGKLHITVSRNGKEKRTRRILELLMEGYSEADIREKLDIDIITYWSILAKIKYRARKDPQFRDMLYVC